MNSVTQAPPKALPGDFTGRFREILSDPLNLLVARDPRAGLVEDGMVYLHTGAKVPISGSMAYYSEFSKILSINRGVHEPLEEFVFQQVVRHLPRSPSMLELGAYWGHYSMWLKTARPDASVCLVEPDENNLNAGIFNFSNNAMEGKFVHAFVAKGRFEVDRHLSGHGPGHLTVLHSDIQGHEVEMLENACQSLAERRIDYLFVSTHSQPLHLRVVEMLTRHGYRIEVAADFDQDTTSHDGLVFAVSPEVRPVFASFTPMGRERIAMARPDTLVRYLAEVSARIQHV